MDHLNVNHQMEDKYEITENRKWKSVQIKNPLSQKLKLI